MRRRWWRFWRRLQCRMQGGHHWWLQDADDTGARLEKRSPYPPGTGDAGVYCLDCDYGFVPCHCFTCRLKPFKDRELLRFPWGQPFVRVTRFLRTGRLWLSTDVVADLPPTVEVMPLPPNPWNPSPLR
jgi:hypothetical protein